MRKLFFSLAVALAPLAAMSPILLAPAHAAAAVTGLGDLSAMKAIVADTLKLANQGDLQAAEKRITDFETAWDAAQKKLRPLNTERWTTIDHAADAAIEALRADAPTADEVVPALDQLLVLLDTPAASPTVTAAAASLSITNSDGSPVPCEVALEDLRKAAATTAPAAADKAKYDALLDKGIERCNADDDKRADDFFAQAFAVLGH